MKIKVQKFGILATAKALGAMYFVGTLAIFIPVGLIMMVAKPDEAMKSVFFVFLPLIYGIVGFVGVAVACALYNFLSPYTGGIEFETGSDS